jgi:hypothetical protein
MPPVRDENVGAERQTGRGESISQGCSDAPVAGTGEEGTMVRPRPTRAMARRRATGISEHVGGSR